MDDKLLVPAAILEDESPRRPVLDCLTDAMKKRAETIPSQFMNKSAYELEKLVDPTPMQRQLKMKFWHEYEASTVAGRALIRPHAIYETVCAKNLFYYHIGQPAFFAWLLQPVSTFETKVLETLDYCLDRMRNEIVKAPLFDDKGKFDSQAAGIVMSAFKVLDARIHGSPMQRIQQHSVHIHKTDGESLSRDDLRKELDDIRMRLEMSRAPRLESRAVDGKEE